MTHTSKWKHQFFYNFQYLRLKELIQVILQIGFVTVNF